MVCQWIWRDDTLVNPAEVVGCVDFVRSICGSDSDTGGKNAKPVNPVTRAFQLRIREPKVFLVPKVNPRLVFRFDRNTEMSENATDVFLYPPLRAR